MGNTGPTPAPRKEFFWARVDKDGPIPAHCPELGQCWVWTGSKAGSFGYGAIGKSRKLGTKSVLAHRFSWTLHYGEVPDELQILHRCDNPPCVRPYHLFIGTQQDNVRDCYNKKRRLPPRPQPGDWLRGEEVPWRKLSWAKIDEIRKLHKDGHSRAAIGRQFAVSATTVFHIVHGGKWKEEYRPLC